MWCSFHKSTTHSNETCRTLQQQLGNNGSANCANQGSDYPAVLTASDPPPGSNIEEQGISFAAVEVPTRDEPSKEESFWPFGPTGVAVASFDTSGFFSGFGGTTSEETINSGAQAPGTRTHITGTLKTLARALIMVVMLHYAWLTLGGFLANRVAFTNTSGQPETFGGITNAEDGLTLVAVPAAEKWNRGSNSLVSVMVDSGASGHYFDDALTLRLRCRLENYQELAIRRYITTAGGHQLEGAGQGLLRGHIIDAQGVERLIQISVLIVPGLGRNLFSVKQASRNGVISIFDKYNPRLEANNFTLPLQKLENDLYFFSLDLVSGSSAPELATQAAATATLWHRRMGHLNRKSLDLLKKVNNNGVSFDGTVPDCGVCAVGESRQRAHPKTANQHLQHLFQLVFKYLLGQFTPEALGGYKYVSKISDEHTRWTEIYLLKSKDGALHAFQSFVQSMVIPNGVRVEWLRADKRKGHQLLMQELPPGDDPDRDNKSHNYIIDDNFLRDLRSYTSVVDHPGSASTDHVTASRRSENTLVAELLGRISAITRRDLLEVGALRGEAPPTGEVPQDGVLERPEQPTSPAGGPVEAPLAGSSSLQQPGSSSLQQHGQSRHEVTPALTRAGNAARSLRERRANDSAHPAEIATDGTLSELRRLVLYTKALLPDVVHHTNKAESVVEYACATTNVQRYSVGEKMKVIPNTFKEAMTLPAKAHWKAAPNKEVASLKKNKVYTLVPATAVPAGHKIVGSRWVYKVKADKSYKGRVVVLGWGQVPSVDCGGTFAPVCRLQSIRMVLAIATEFDFECWQLDYNTAFLNAKVEEEVYVKMAPGHEDFSNDGVQMVMRLLKSLYGLRQSPRCWYGAVDKHGVEIGFKSLKSDPCVYIYSDGGAIYVLTLYVDDVLLLGKDRKVLERIKRKLMGRLSMTDIGDVLLVFGMDVTHDRTKGTVIITQENCVKSLLERVGMGNCNPAHTPGVGKELSLDQPEENLLNKEDKRRFQAITGSVMCLGQVTRYDIGYAVNQLARAM